MPVKQHLLGENKIFVEEKIPLRQEFNHPIVFAHSSFGGYFMWDSITDRFAGQGFHTFALSLRGHKPSGETDLSKVSMSDYEQDLKVVTEKLGLANPVVAGHSLSGLVVLMYARDHEASAVVSMDPSQSLEVQGEGDLQEIEKIPLVYTPMEAGLPADPGEAMKAMPDIPRETLMKMKDLLGPESGRARRDRKKGISVPKGSIKAPLLVMGAGLGDSLPFGISLQSSRQMAAFYGAEFIGIPGASHPGMLMGEHAGKVAESIISWLKKNIN